MKKKVYSIKIPGKTFITGEYLALYGGNSLLVTTKPGFEVFFVLKSQNHNRDNLEERNANIIFLTQSIGVNKDLIDLDFLSGNKSPAEKFYQHNLSLFLDWNIYFIDGYAKAGGFGASTAQFLALYHFRNLMQNNYIEFSQIDLDDLLIAYWQCHDSESVPSGNDLIAQQFAGLSIVSKINFPSQSLKSNNSAFLRAEAFKSVEFENFEVSQRPLKWAFENLEFFLVPTKLKSPTHEHLKGLKEINISILKEIQEKTEAFLFIQDEEAFNLAINEWYQEQLKLNLVCENTMNIVKKAKNIPEIKSIKGCGALGSDVIFLTFNKQDKERVKQWLIENQLGNYFGLEHLWTQTIKLEGVYGF